MGQPVQVQWIVLRPDDTGIVQRLPDNLLVREGCTVLEALRLLNIAEQPEVLLEQRAVSIYGQYALADTVLHAGDRIEILDSLRFDPKESRRRRATHKQQSGQQNKKVAPRRSQKQS